MQPKFITVDVAHVYFSNLMSNPDLTLSDLLDNLKDPAWGPHLEQINLGEVFNNALTRPIMRSTKESTRKHEAMPSVADMLMGSLKRLDDWVSPSDLAEAVGSSQVYVTRVLMDGIAKNTMPVIMRHVQQHEKGRPTPMFRYSAGMETLNQEGGTQE